MKARATRLLKKVLQKVSGRDYIILNPEWASLGGEGYNLIATGQGRKQFLPIRYSYHTPRDWDLHYDIRGYQSGLLRYSLRTPETEPFCTVEMQVRLPFTWRVRLEDGHLVGNNGQLPLVAGGALPRETPWLLGEFEFQPAEGTTLYRRTAHRVKLEPGVSDSDYFNGLVYHSYAEDAAGIPREVMETLGRFHPLKGRFLDIGCAMGLLVQAAQATGMEAEGIDSSAWAVEQANQRTGGVCRVVDFERAEPSEFTSTYDIVTMHDVIEHLSDPARALKILFGLCRPGGIAYIHTLNADSLMHKIMDQDWCGYTDYTHQSPWLTPDWITTTARETGFEVIYLRRYSIWNDNIYDDVWRSFSSLAQIYPASVALEDQFGDLMEVVLRRPENS